MSNKRLNIAISRLERHKKARDDADKAMEAEREKVMKQMGEVLFAAATKPRSQWSKYQDLPLRDLLTELGVKSAPQDIQSTAQQVARQPQQPQQNNGAQGNNVPF
ncbi:hypothetical protein [Corynebacterium sp. HMSC05E07]|uniref:hypothetical protein n=1 Tax=Corynebacterium sp. HMSC05E07 TaxID=1581117 RepID=UPI00114CF4DC|nr:hypothetical protein [Corynebacterium sp. HMSC05E07]